MLRLFLVFFCFALLQNVHAQQIDVQHYKYDLQLTDASDTLNGTATITVKFLENTDRFYLNLATIKAGKGMQVTRITAHDTTFSFTHVQDTLFIRLPYTASKSSVQTVAITYAGVPADGLIISKNKWNERTFFGDNWPNRAHQWLPCNDQPNDKATVEFEVTAPAQYKVISNGTLVEEKKINPSQTFTHWTEPTPIPTKVMVIGVARFAVKEFADSSITPASAWVYPQDSTKGFYDYALAPAIIKFYTTYIGPFPFEKLANVQSTTIFGGMENASCIFYDEKTVTGTRKSEALLAHEIAHQWFGNSATEKSFAHLWLSEGFATYMAHLYLEQKYGRDTLIKRLQEDRKKVIRFAKQWPYPVVDSTSALMDLLNANSYEKGGWVLHMLRQQVGDTLFQKIISAYYNQYKFSNADTWDFEKVTEDVSGKDLKQFFQQWIFTPGVPKLHIKAYAEKDLFQLTITQDQNFNYAFPLEIEIADSNGHKQRFTITITSKEQVFKYSNGLRIKQIIVDPDCKLLYEGGLVK